MDPRKLMQHLMDAEGLNPNSLAAATNRRTKQPQIHRFIKGVSAEPRRSTLAPVAHYFRVPLEAFFDPSVADGVYRERFGAERSDPTPPLEAAQAKTVSLIAELAAKLPMDQQEQLLVAAEVLSGPLGARIAMSFAIAGPRVAEPIDELARIRKKPA